MVSDDNEELSRETKYSHLIQAASPIIYVFIWILDSQIFGFSVFLNNFVPLAIRIVLFAVTLIFALILMKLSHDTSFKHNEPSDTLITNGILSRVRNPLYLGVLLIYLALLFLSISLISMVLFIIISIIYNKMVNHEESVLEKLFGEEYLKYKKSVPKWIPKLF